MLNLCCYLYCASYLWFYFFLNILRPPRSNRLTHSFPTRRSSDLVERRAVDEQAIFGRVDPAIARIGPRRGLGHGETGIEMQFARPAIVIETIGAVDILLHLDDGPPRPQRVDRPRPVIDELIGMCRPPVAQIDHRSVERGAVECLARRGGAQPHPTLGAGGGAWARAGPGWGGRGRGRAG